MVYELNCERRFGGVGVRSFGGDGIVLKNVFGDLGGLGGILEVLGVFCGRNNQFQKYTPIHPDLFAHIHTLCDDCLTIHSHYTLTLVLKDVLGNWGGGLGGVLAMFWGC